MSDDQRRLTDTDLDAMLRDMEAGDLELIEPPADVWAGIESATRVAEDARGNVVSLDSRRRARRWLVVGVAAVLVLVVAGVATFMLARDGSGQVVASASLVYDPANFDALGSLARADADLVEDGGSHSISIVDADLPAPEAGADLEVWLIRPDAEGNVADLVSLGLVDPADPGRLEVPAGYDPGAYFVVDISVEPRDGDAGHSGRSILRGPLQEV